MVEQDPRTRTSTTPLADRLNRFLHPRQTLTKDIYDEAARLLTTEKLVFVPAEKGFSHPHVELRYGDHAVIGTTDIDEHNKKPTNPLSSIYLEGSEIICSGYSYEITRIDRLWRRPKYQLETYNWGDIELRYYAPRQRRNLREVKEVLSSLPPKEEKRREQEQEQEQERGTRKRTSKHEFRS